MVFTFAICALNLASTLVANGICCMYQMQKEEERKKEYEAFLKDLIQSEWDRHHNRRESQDVKKEQGETEKEEDDTDDRNPVEGQRIRPTQSTDDIPRYLVPDTSFLIRSRDTNQCPMNQLCMDDDEEQQSHRIILIPQEDPLFQRESIISPKKEETTYQGKDITASLSSSSSLFFRDHMSHVVSLVDDSDDEIQQMEEVCVE